MVNGFQTFSATAQHAHTTMQCLPAQGSNRFPWGTRWNRWNPTSEVTPATAALCVAAPPDGAPACWGCTVSLQSLIYRYIFPSYHTVVTQSPGDCSHIAHRIASLSPTTYWALKPKRRKNKETRQSWAYGIIQEIEAGVFWNFLLKASLTSENDLLVVNNKMYLCERSQNWQALMRGPQHRAGLSLETDTENNILIDGIIHFNLLIFLKLQWKLSLFPMFIYWN